MEKYESEEIKHYTFLTHKQFILYTRNECLKNSAIPAARPVLSLLYENSCKGNLTCVEYTVFIVGLLYTLAPSPRNLLTFMYKGNIIIQYEIK